MNAESTEFMNGWEAGDICKRCGARSLRFVRELCWLCHQKALTRMTVDVEKAEVVREVRRKLALRKRGQQ